MSEDYTGYLEHVNKAAGGADLALLSNLAEQQAAAEDKVAKIQADLEQAQRELKKLSEDKIPEAMEAVGMKEFVTATGLKVEVNEVVRASIPVARQEEGYQWLRDHGNGGLIKRLVSVSFGKGEDEKAEEMAKLLAEKEYEYEDKSSVHNQTLTAFVREQLKAGKELPMELFGVHQQNVAKIKRPS